MLRQRVRDMQIYQIKMYRDRHLRTLEIWKHRDWLSKSNKLYQKIEATYILEEVCLLTHHQTTMASTLKLTNQEEEWLLTYHQTKLTIVTLILMLTCHLSTRMRNQSIDHFLYNKPTRSQYRPAGRCLKGKLSGIGRVPPRMLLHRNPINIQP